MIKAAKKAGADAVNFKILPQIILLQKMQKSSISNKKYKNKKSQFQMLKRLELKLKDYFI